ncbi:glycerophosphodiester phosphodiesterase family protein [Stutzerimonas stutzeri]|uniref:glycerophosphodiester phosphodiesterase family protein n=2 Tax=Stutzerimonas stutzeri TaxID=316 RepID=UPI003CFEBC88
MNIRHLPILGLTAALASQVVASDFISKEMAEQRRQVEMAKQTTIPWLPADADDRREPEQQVLRTRGLYIDQVGVVRRLKEPEKLGCKGLELEAHRGHPLYPENGIWGVRAGFAARYNAVEVDAQQLRDDTWVLHHDKTNERTLVHPFGSQPVSRLTRNEWTQGFMRGRDGLNTSEPAGDVLSTMVLTGAYRQAGQTMNIEIKNYKSCKALHTLDVMARLTLGYEGVAYSELNSTKALSCMRQQNQTSYMAVIQGPNRKALEAWTKANHGKELAHLKGNRLLRAGANFAKQHFGSYKFPGLNSTRELKQFRQLLGRNSGLHVEIQDLLDDPGIIRRVHAAGMKVKSYTINSNEHHLDGLKKLKARGTLPDGAIVDSTPIRTCKILGLES